MKPKLTKTDTNEQSTPGLQNHSPQSSERATPSGQPSRVNRLYAATFKLRGLLMIPPVAFVLLCTRWEWEYEAGVWSLGLLLFAAGMFLRCWAQRHFKYRVRSEGSRELAVTGPFAYCRNPVYIGNLLLLAGVVVLCELIWAVPFVVLWGSLVYALAVRFEEHRLTKRFGRDYLLYRDGVRRWLPSARRMREAGAVIARPAAWPRVLRAEWQCLALLLVPVVKELVVETPLHHVGSAWTVSLGG